MSRFIVEYCPNISEKAEEIIKNNITPSMVSIEGDSGQYSLDYISSEILGDLPKEDAEVIDNLLLAGVDYIEF